MADCGLRLIASMTGLGWIVECTLGAAQCKDPRLTPPKTMAHVVGRPDGCGCLIGAVAMRAPERLNLQKQADPSAG
eukprot:14934689-Alexandrium_andersonii.AAC.1